MQRGRALTVQKTTSEESTNPRWSITLLPEELKDHLKDISKPLLDHLKFAYLATKSVDNTVNMGLHHILQRLDHPNTYAGILFLDLSSAFNTIIPGQLHSKLTQLNVPASTCQWITNLLTGREQQVRRYDIHQVIVFIQDVDKSAWSSQNKLELNTAKTVEMTVDFRRSPPALLARTTLDRTVMSCGVFGYDNHQDPEVGLHHQLHHQESPTEDVLPSAEEVQPVPAAQCGAAQPPNMILTDCSTSL
ncbi:hypothetical protein NFI96_013113, partial [Prochilodus magdalenae]